MPETQNADPVSQDNPQDVQAGEESLITPSKSNSGSDGATASQSASQGQQPQTFPAWMAQLEGNLKTDTALTKFKTISDLGKAYRELEGKLGKAIIPPDENATAEEIEAFYKKLGRPDHPSKYSLESKAPKEIISQELTEGFKEKAYALGLSEKAANELYAWYTETFAQKYQEAQEKMYEQARFQRQEAERVLKEEFGPAFESKMSLVRRAFARYATPELTEAVNKTGLGNNPEFIKLFLRIGEEMSEGPFVDSNTRAPEKKSPEEILYPSMVQRR